jgi:hypothetical protein
VLERERKRGREREREREVSVSESHAASLYQILSFIVIKNAFIGPQNTCMIENNETFMVVNNNINNTAQ